ncbi:MAG: glycerophosphodiester phosphodiesterase [Chitinophagaceae bacterium]|nr:glycerophosphodiester phosphodiesterase [Chitinophagaceae bacterium]
MRFILCLVIFSLLSCKASKKNTMYTQGKNRPANENSVSASFDKQGHRGCRGLMPENTIAAMIHALDWGVTTLEMDVVITKDKKVILSHEPWFSHLITTLPDGSFIKPGDEVKYNIYQMTYEETRRYDVGMKPHPDFPKQQKMKTVKPLLSEVIDSIQQAMINRRRPPVNYNIETKLRPEGDHRFHPGPEEFVELVMQVVNEKGIRKYVTLQSFDFRTLQYARKKYPDIKISLLIEGNDPRSPEKQLKDLGFVPDVYSPHFKKVTPELIRFCHEKKMKIIPWTVNDKEKIRELMKMGVDGIITDYPDLFD